MAAALPTLIVIGGPTARGSEKKLRLSRKAADGKVTQLVMRAAQDITARVP